MKLKNIFVISLLVLIGGLLFLNYKITNLPPSKILGAQEGQDNFIGRTALDFSVKDIDGKTFKLSENKGKTVILFGFATWCSDCIEEAKTLTKIKQKYQDKGLEIIGVAFTKEETEDSLNRFKKLGNLDIPLSLDTDNVVNKYKIINLSTTFIIDKKGKIVYRDEENTSEETYFKELNKILKE